MKVKLLILFLGLSISVKAQSIKDSVAKYYELHRFYLYTDSFKVWEKFYDKFKYWNAKQDSIDNIEKQKAFAIKRKLLEQKYKMKLP